MILPNKKMSDNAKREGEKMNAFMKTEEWKKEMEKSVNSKTYIPEMTDVTGPMIFVRDEVKNCIPEGVEI